MRLRIITAALSLLASAGWATGAPAQTPPAPPQGASAVCPGLWLSGGELHDAASGVLVWSEASETVTALACPGGGEPTAAIGATRGARGDGKIVLLAPGAVPGAPWSVTGEIATRGVPRWLALEGGRLAVVVEGRKDASFGVVDAVADARLQTVVVSQKPVGLAVSPDGASFVLAAGSDLRTFRVDDGRTRAIVPFPEPIVALASQKGVGRILVGQGSRVVAVDPRDKPDRGALPVRAQAELPGPAKRLSWMDGGRAAGALIAEPSSILILGGNDLALLDRREQQADAIGASGAPGVSELRWVRAGKEKTTGVVHLSAEPPKLAPYEPAPLPVPEVAAPTAGTTSASPGPAAATGAPVTPPAVVARPVVVPPPSAAKIEAPPAKPEAPPVKVEAPPAKVEAPPAKPEAPPAKVEAPQPAKAEAPPAKIEAPPANTGAPAAKSGSPAVEAPPQGASAPPVVPPPPPPVPSPAKSAPPPAVKPESAPATQPPPVAKTEPPPAAPDKLPDAPPVAVPTPTSHPPATTPPPPPASPLAPQAAQQTTAAPQATQQTAQPSAPQTAPTIPPTTAPQTAPTIPPPAAPQATPQTSPQAPASKPEGETARGGSIMGTITGQLALVAEVVILGPDSLLKQFARVKVVPSEGSASFTLDHVPPGRYAVTPMGAHNASLSARPATARVVVSGDAARADFEILGAL